MDDGIAKNEYQMTLELLILQLNLTVIEDSFGLKYDIPSPVPYIHEITQIGKVVVRFNTTMNFPPEELIEDKQ